MAILGGAIIAGSCMSASNNNDRLIKKYLPEAVIVDVRTVGEYEARHIPGAINIPVDILADHVQQLGAVDEPIILYCRSGSRAHIADQILRDMGYTKVAVGGSLTKMEKLIGSKNR